MRKPAVWALTGLLGVAPASALTVEEVIAKHVEAKGGEHWDAVRTMKVSGSYTAFSVTEPFTLQRKRERLYHLDAVQAGTRTIVGFDGETAWVVRDEGPELVEGLSRSVLLRDVEFATPLFGYTDRGIAARLLGEVEFDGSTTIGVELTHPDASVDTWYLDPRTYLERGVTSPGVDYLGPTEKTTYFEDFRDVQGLKLPFYIEAQWLTRELVIEVDQVLTNVEIDDATFRMPLPVGMDLLAPLAGAWTVKLSQRSGPDEEWQESERESRIESSMRGGLLEERYRTAEGTEVVRTFSYDRFSERYRVTQFDGRRNQMNVQEGRKDADGRLVVSNVDTGTSWSAWGTTYHSRLAVFDVTDGGFTMEHETSTDGGKTWFVNARATYARKAG